MLHSAHQGYIYQDILGAFFVANELANGRTSTQFLFDKKKSPTGVPDKFDDIRIYSEASTLYIQVKYSNSSSAHSLTKKDFSSAGSYDLALFDLFTSWRVTKKSCIKFRVCLAWNPPIKNDKINEVLREVSSELNLIPGSRCYKFDIESLWPINQGVLPSWKKLAEKSSLIERSEFKRFLDDLVLELNLPKSSLLRHYKTGLDELLYLSLEKVGIGVYPNDHLSIPTVAEKLCSITRRIRAESQPAPISCKEIADIVGIIRDFGGVEQKFPIDYNLIVNTNNRTQQVLGALDDHKAVILTAEPGAGKSWFIENLEKHVKDEFAIIKHYCYIAINDPLSHDRITSNVLYGSLIQQINSSNLSSVSKMTKRYASNLEQLNILLDNINSKTLLIVDGLDHIWRIYQKNRGGVTENETAILKSLSKLSRSNKNVSFLIISQPIYELDELENLFHICKLEPIDEQFVKELLDKHAISNFSIEEDSLSKEILRKSNGNALYCKYIIDQLKNQISIESVKNLPPYDFNLTAYYEYLFEQIQENINIPAALCGADFSLRESEIRDITHFGDIVSKQLALLLPILKFSASGYSIYHESFKRFIIDLLKNKGVSIDRFVYRPLIDWLETHSFFESIKAYKHLLKLYFEVESIDKISATISEDFIEQSIYYAQPLEVIQNNHALQKKALKQHGSLADIVIIAEQAKVVYELDNISESAFISYIKAIKLIHGEETMYRVLWDGEDLLVDTGVALRLLVEEAYEGSKSIHWSIIPQQTTVSHENIGLYAIMLVDSQDYKRFDDLIKHVKKNHTEALESVIEEIEWWFIYRDYKFIEHTPFFKKIIQKRRPKINTFLECINYVLKSEKFIYDQNWKKILQDIQLMAKVIRQEEQILAEKKLSSINWFYNWIIYLIKISQLSERSFKSAELLEAFSYLVRDTDPFKGNPRACDLYSQLTFIKKSFHYGLKLAVKDKIVLFECLKLLEKVTNLTTSIQNSHSGPLTDEEYLDILSLYYPGEYTLGKLQEYYRPLGSRRVYFDVAEIAFNYSRILSISQNNNLALEKYKEGVQSLVAYGGRKDRTLSEVLYSSVPFQQTYHSLTPEWFYDLYRMSMTVVTHTDGKSTSSYPIEWFEEFIKVYPNEALKFLICETLENSQATWHQESEFHHVIEKYSEIFTPTEWYLLVRSMPLAASDLILLNAFNYIDKVDHSIKSSFMRWIETIPYINKESKYNSKIVAKYKSHFGEKINSNHESTKVDRPVEKIKVSQFPTNSMQDALAFLETDSLNKDHTKNLRNLVSTIDNKEDKKKFIREVAFSFRYGRGVEEWVDELFEINTEEWFYFSVCLFVYVSDGWNHGFHYLKYIKRVYQLDSHKTLSELKEVLSWSIAETSSSYLISGNLIKALSQLGVDEFIVKDLISLTFRIVDKRLPHPPDYNVNQNLYNGLEKLNKNEIVVALLISRFKTLTTLKNQNIIWSLIYLAKSKPEVLFKPYILIFSNSDLLLPIQRAVLLQVLVDYVDKKLIPDDLIAQLLTTYPTGFFLEDQLVRSFLNYEVPLAENPNAGIQHNKHKYDHGFFPFIHMKYQTLEAHFGILDGSFTAYTYKRDNISKEYNNYYIRTEELLTTIVANANAVYEIANVQWYEDLKGLTHYYHEGFLCDLEFCLPEIQLRTGSLSKRPSCLPHPSDFPDFELQKSTLNEMGWVLLASKEKEIIGDQFRKKSTVSASRVISFDISKEQEDEYEYASYLFKSTNYSHDKSIFEKKDQPICVLEIKDTLEELEIVFVSPWIINELGLSINHDLQNGFEALNKHGDCVIKLVTWTEEYYGKINDGTEVPGRKGTAVLIKSKYLPKLLQLSNGNFHYVLRSFRY